MKNIKYDWSTLHLADQLKLLALSLEAGLHFSHFYHILSAEYPDSLLGHELAQLEEHEFQTNTEVFNVLKNFSHPMAHTLYHVVVTAEATGSYSTLKDLAKHFEELALVELEENQWPPQIDVLYLEDLARLLNVIEMGFRNGLSYRQAIDLATDPINSPHPSEISDDLRNTERSQLTELLKKYPDPFFQIFVIDTNILLQTGGNMAEAYKSIAILIRKFLLVDLKFKLKKR